ncbi:MAG: methyltransferase [Acidobacteriaceae bacterium]
MPNLTRTLKAQELGALGTGNSSAATARKWMRASRFEFRWRLVIMLVIFAGCFAASAWQSNGHLGYLWILITTWMSKLDRFTNETNSLILKVAVSALVVVSAALRTWAAAYLDSSVVQAGAVQTELVVAAGPYAYMRNPLYLGTILLALSLAPMNGPGEGLALVVLVVLFAMRLIRREELELAAVQGREYLQYKSAVPALFPKLPNRAVIIGAARPQWRQAFLGEIFPWVMAAGVIGYAVTFRAEWLGRAALIGLGLSFVVRALRGLR